MTAVTECPQHLQRRQKWVHHAQISQCISSGEQRLHHSRELLTELLRHHWGSLSSLLSYARLREPECTLLQLTWFVSNSSLNQKGPFVRPHPFFAFNSG